LKKKKKKRKKSGRELDLELWNIESDIRGEPSCCSIERTQSLEDRAEKERRERE